MKKTATSMTTVLAIALCMSAQHKQDSEKVAVYLAASCDKNPTGEIVESSLRESIRSSAGYVLAEKQELGVFMISLACINAGSEGEGWTAVGYFQGLIVKTQPETLGTAVWGPTLGVFTVGRAHAQSKGQELFAKFDNSMHKQ
jgi:hypothetical protein